MSAQILDIEILRLAMLCVENPMTTEPNSFAAAKSLGLVHVVNNTPQRTRAGEVVYQRRFGKNQPLEVA